MFAKYKVSSIPKSLYQHKLLYNMVKKELSNKSYRIIATF